MAGVGDLRGAILEGADHADTAMANSVNFVTVDSTDSDTDPVAPDVTQDQAGLNEEVKKRGAGDYIHTESGGWVNSGTLKGVTAVGLDGQAVSNKIDLGMNAVKTVNDNTGKIKQGLRPQG